MKALIVEDEPIFKELIHSSLSLLGVNVQKIRDTATEAIQLLNSDTFELVVLDLKLARGTGIDVLAHIYDSNISIPVLIFSGFVHEYKEEIINCTNDLITLDIVDKRDTDDFTLAQKIKKLLDDHECKKLKNDFVIMKDEIKSLQEKTKILEETHPTKINVAKEVKDLSKNIFLNIIFSVLRNKKALLAIIASLAGLIISLFSGIASEKAFESFIKSIEQALEHKEENQNTSNN